MKKVLIKKIDFVDLPDRLKKMSKIVVEEFDVCHKFVSEVVEFILPIEQRRFVLVEHNVSCEDFIIFVGYDKSLFEHKVHEFVGEIIKEAGKSCLRKYWDVDCAILDEAENFLHEYFPYSVVISFKSI